MLVCHLFFFLLVFVVLAALSLRVVPVVLLSTALAKHHANGDTSMVTEIENLCPIM